MKGKLFRGQQQTPNILPAIEYKLVLPEKVDVNSTRNSSGFISSFPNNSLTPLMRASICGHIKAVTLLLQHQPNLEQKNRHGDTALFLAAANYRPEIVELLLNAKSNIDTQNVAGYTPLMKAVSHYEKGDDNDNRALHTAACLLAYRADIYLKDKIKGWGRTALMHAVMCRNLKQVMSLLNHTEKNLEVRDEEGCTALMIAASEYIPKPAIVLTLLEHGAQVDSVDDKGNTVLSSALANGNIQLVEIFEKFIRMRMLVESLFFLIPDLIKIIVGYDMEMEIYNIQTQEKISMASALTKLTLLKSSQNSSVAAPVSIELISGYSKSV